MASDVKNLVMDIHDLTISKDKVIKDTNYRKYLPGRHHFLRGMYQLWIVMIILAILLFLLRYIFNVEMAIEFVYYPFLGIFLYSLLMLALSLILVQARYVVPIAATNEVKARKIIKINKKLNDAKKKLRERLRFEVIKDFIRKGKFNPDDLSDSMEFYMRTNFPQLDYIKDIFNVEILKNVETKVVNYMNEFSIELRKDFMSKVANLQEITDKKGLNPGFIIGMVKWMVNKKIIFGMLTENELEFVPEEFLSSFAAQPVIADQATSSPEQDAPASVQADAGAPQATTEPAPAVNPTTANPDDATPQAAAPVVATTQDDDATPQPTGALDDIAAVKSRIDEAKKNIEKVKESYERGNIGVDHYIHKIEVLEKELGFLKHKMELLERIQAPETHCMYCFLFIDNPDDHVKCPNGHVFHVHCAHEYLQKYEKCPWCEEKVKKPAFI